jgi:Domain of unknown function (DUF4352)
MAKFCVKCGTKTTDDVSLFCNICGTKLSEYSPEKKSDKFQDSGVIPVSEGKDDPMGIKKYSVLSTTTGNAGKNKRRIDIGIIVVLGILFSLIILGIIIPPQDNFFGIFSLPKGNSSDTSPVLQHTPASQANLTPTPKLTPSPKPTSPQTTLTSNESSIAPEALVLAIGEGAGDGTKSVMVFSVNKTSKYSYYSINKTQVETAPSGKTFVIVDVGIKNTGSQYLNVSAAAFSITDSNGYKYDPSVSYRGDDGFMVQQLYLNQISRGKVLFVIPTASKGLRLQYDFGDLITGPKLATWSIK